MLSFIHANHFGRHLLALISWTFVIAAQTHAAATAAPPKENLSLHKKAGSTSAWVLVTTSGPHERDEAWSLCRISARDNTWASLRCTWGKETLYEGSRAALVNTSSSKTEYPRPKEIPATKKEQGEMWTHEGDGWQLIVTLKPRTYAEALQLCKDNAAGNPNSGLRCMWAGTKIFEYVPVEIVTTPVALDDEPASAEKRAFRYKIGDKDYYETFLISLGEAMRRCNEAILAEPKKNPKAVTCAWDGKEIGNNRTLSITGKKTLEIFEWKADKDGKFSWVSFSKKASLPLDVAQDLCKSTTDKNSTSTFLCTFDGKSIFTSQRQYLVNVDKGTNSDKKDTDTKDKDKDKGNGGGTGGGTNNPVVRLDPPETGKLEISIKELVIVPKKPPSVTDWRVVLSISGVAQAAADVICKNYQGHSNVAKIKCTWKSVLLRDEDYVPKATDPGTGPQGKYTATLNVNSKWGKDPAEIDSYITRQAAFDRCLGLAALHAAAQQQKAADAASEIKCMWNGQNIFSGTVQNALLGANPMNILNELSRESDFSAWISIAKTYVKMSKEETAEYCRSKSGGHPKGYKCIWNSDVVYEGPVSGFSVSFLPGRGQKWVNKENPAWANLTKEAALRACRDSALEAGKAYLSMRCEWDGAKVYDGKVSEVTNKIVPPLEEGSVYGSVLVNYRPEKHKGWREHVFFKNVLRTEAIKVCEKSNFELKNMPAFQCKFSGRQFFNRKEPLKPDEKGTIPLEPFMRAETEKKAAEAKEKKSDSTDSKAEKSL